MAILPSDTAIQYANQVMGLVQQLRNLRPSIAELITVNSNNPLGNFWAALTTTALNADGTLGTADGSPSESHPVDPRVYPALSRAVSPTALGNALQILVDFNTFLAGTSLSSNAGRPAEIDAVAM